MVVVLGTARMGNRSGHKRNDPSAEVGADLFLSRMHSVGSRLKIRCRLAALIKIAALTVPPGGAQVIAMEISMPDKDCLTGSANQQRNSDGGRSAVFGTRFENEHWINGEIMETVNGLEPG